ncbi:MAG: hypothetical protein NTU88_09630, partial [Armatimonadetes bacterium]|nr:hypothetical protein [Armatimonadota bacterium]
ATGRLNRFAVAPDVKLLDVSAPAVYSGVKEYRRTMLLIGGESESPYLVDFFTVEGGHSHDYSLHGFDGEFRTEGIDLVAQEQGTLAGEDVPFTYLFDDPDLEKPDKTRSYGSYTGSGYSYLYNVKRGIPTRSWSATWQEKDFGVRAIFPDQPLKEAVIADGNPPKRPGNPDSLKYVLLRRSGDECLSSRFACVFQPFKTGDQPLKVRRLPVESGVLLEITGSQGTDLVYLADDGRMGERESGGKGEWATGRKGDGEAGRQGEPTAPSSPTSGGRNEGRGLSTYTIGGLSISGECAILRMGPEHELKSVFLGGGGHIKQGMLSVESGPSLSGTLSTVNYESNELELSPLPEQSANPQSANPQSEIRNPKSGTTILFDSANYPIHSARGKDGRLVISLGEDSPRIGKLAVESIDPEGKFVSTKTALYFANAECYKDKWLVNEDFTAWHRVADVEGGTVTLRDPADLKSEFTDKDGDGRITAYLYDVGPGQEYIIPAACWVGRDTSGKWTMQSTTPAKASLPDGTRLGNG